MEKLQIGPTGGNGGKPFDQYDIPDDAHLTAIHLYTDWVINAIQVDFETADGVRTGRPPIGGLGGEHHVFYLDEDEYVTGISGRAGWYVDSIRIHTNRRVSGLYGGSGGDHDFSFEAPPDYEISGFFGRSAWYLDALGVNARKRTEGSTEDSAAMASEGTEMDGDQDDVESWLELAGEGEPVAATVIVRREVVVSEEDLDALEDAALAEVIAAAEGEEGEEGTVDVAIYTQIVDDNATGKMIAVVMAVAVETSGDMEAPGNEPAEAAVMVTDAIESDDDLAILEEEAVEGAIDTLLEEAGGDVDEVELTIYSGVSDEETTGQVYGAVVAIASKVSARNGSPIGGDVPLKVLSQEPKPKDLELVEGIGPKIAELLIEHGILDLADLAAEPVERLREILGTAGRRFRLANPGSWPEQAALGAAGLWDALSELQARLKAGR